MEGIDKAVELGYNPVKVCLWFQALFSKSCYPYI